MDFYKNATSVMQVIDFLEYIRDEEILPNSAKVIRIVLRDDKIFENLVNNHMELGNILVGSLQKYSFSEVVIIELLAKLRNFTRVPQRYH
jgi:hypothetical protein